jgi:hypothetical protein
VVYDSIKLDAGYKLDLLVEDTVVVELKAIEALAPIHQAQVISIFDSYRKTDRPVNQLSLSASKRRHQEVRCLNDYHIFLCVLCG